MKVRPEVLALVREDILDPERRIVDPHHHFFEQYGGLGFYSLDDLWQDTASHNVEQTVYMQCYEHYRTSGPKHLAVVGETEWVDGIAAVAAQGNREAARIGGIVGEANLLQGDSVEEVLEAHLAASSLFRGIRESAAWAEGDEVLRSSPTGDAFLYRDKRFRAGFSRLAGLGLSFDAYHYHMQTSSMTELARAFPDTTIVVDHLSTPLGIGPFADKRNEIFDVWCRDITELATCANVNMKLGGMAMPWSGYGWHEAKRPPTSDEFVALQGRYYCHAIESFGPDRCMFESNFPVDKLSISYAVLWNAFKKIAANYSEGEKESLFRGTAMRVYRLQAR